MPARTRADIDPGRGRRRRADRPYGRDPARYRRRSPCNAGASLRDRRPRSRGASPLACGCLCPGDSAPAKPAPFADARRAPISKSPFFRKAILNPRWGRSASLAGSNPRTLSNHSGGLGNAAHAYAAVIRTKPKILHVSSRAPEGFHIPGASCLILSASDRSWSRGSQYPPVTRRTPPSRGRMLGNTPLPRGAMPMRGRLLRKLPM